MKRRSHTELSREEEGVLKLTGSEYAPLLEHELRENQDTTPHEAGSDPRRESDWPTIRASWLYRAGMCSLGAASLTAEAGGRGSGKRSYAFLTSTKGHK